MNRTLNSLQKIKFNPLVNRIKFEQGKKKYLLNKYKFMTVNLKSINLNPVIIRKYTTSSDNYPNDNNDYWFIIGIITVVIMKLKNNSK